MIGQFFDTMIVPTTIKELLESLGKCWKLFCAISVSVELVGNVGYVKKRLVLDLEKGFYQKSDALCQANTTKLHSN